VDNPVHLDPATLRVLAAQLDAEAEQFEQQCKCMLHQLLRNQAVERAADYRTLAIKAELPAPAAEAGEPS
jgi:hypothetical protein